MKKEFQKKIMCIALIIALATSLLIIYINNEHNRFSFKGTVIDVSETSLLVSVNPDEDEIRSSDKISVSLYNKSNNNFDFKIGDKVEVFYNGVILESYPAMINDVYKIIKLN